MLLNFKILVFFWRQFYQEKGKRMNTKMSDDHTFEEFEGENAFDRVRKFVQLIFIYYKRSQADRVWEFRQDQIPDETVMISLL